MSKPASEGEITQLLISWRGGDHESVNRLFSLVYDQLRSLARRQLRRSGGDRTLNTSALVHEGYLKLVDQSQATINDRNHFFAIAARAMRQILIDDARRRTAAKRGGGQYMAQLDEDHLAVDARAYELVAVDEALQRLDALDPHMVKLVELRFFAGLSVEETADTLSVSARTVKREWHKARAYLYRELTGSGRS
jgi:RNA polymerase sigma factor (TIGR02999 family)